MVSGHSTCSAGPQKIWQGAPFVLWPLSWPTHLEKHLVGLDGGPAKPCTCADWRHSRFHKSWKQGLEPWSRDWEKCG